jgi:hypothetical protein
MYFCTPMASRKDINALHFLKNNKAQKLHPEMPWVARFSLAPRASP